MDKPIRKKFDYDLFKANDKIARDIGKKYWNSLHYDAIDNPDRYGPDLIVTEPVIDPGVSKSFYC